MLAEFVSHYLRTDEVESGTRRHFLLSLLSEDRGVLGGEESRKLDLRK